MTPADALYRAFPSSPRRFAKAASWRPDQELLVTRAITRFRSFAVLAWFFHPAAFILATLWVLIILVRRDYFSRSLRLLSGI